MIGRAAERKRQAQARHALQHHVEQDGVFDGEQPSPSIVDAKLRLQAGGPRRGAQKAFGCIAQLARRRRVLGVEDGDELPAH